MDVPLAAAFLATVHGSDAEIVVLVLVLAPVESVDVVDCTGRAVVAAADKQGN